MSGKTYVTTIWPGQLQPIACRGLAIPAHFGETLQRNAEHFEVLLGLLKLFAHALEEDGMADPPFWRERARRAEAILAEGRDPD